MAATKTVTASTMCAAMAPLNAPRAATMATPPTMAMVAVPRAHARGAAVTVSCKRFSSLAMMATPTLVVLVMPIVREPVADPLAVMAINAQRPKLATMAPQIAAVIATVTAVAGASPQFAVMVKFVSPPKLVMMAMPMPAVLATQIARLRGQALPAVMAVCARSLKYVTILIPVTAMAARVIAPVLIMFAGTASSSVPRSVMTGQ
jgi:hypothetical protein